MSRPLVLPELPPHFGERFGRGDRCWGADQVREAMRAAVELDRRGIVVTDEDVVAAREAYWSTESEAQFDRFKAALESFVARKRGEARAGIRWAG